LWLVPGAVEVYDKCSSLHNPYYVGGYHNTEEIDKLAGPPHNIIAPDMIQRLKKYFGDDLYRIRSYVSLPLFDSKGKIFGVLNVHSNCAFLFGEDRERQLNFGLIVAPLVTQIAETCILLGMPK
jgi:hypothetical protein